LSENFKEKRGQKKNERGQQYEEKRERQRGEKEIAQEQEFGQRENYISLERGKKGRGEMPMLRCLSPQ